MIPIFTMQLDIRSEANKTFGFSKRVTILLYEGCCRVLSILMSFSVREKNAISAPEKRKDNTKSTTNTKTKMVVSAEVMANIVSN
jgi:hypothetical protein